MPELTPQQIEKDLYAAVSSGDVAAATETLSSAGREALEFSGRCFSVAITAGDVEMALFCARNDFHLNVLDEPTLRAARSDPDRAGHALREYLQNYRYCRAQRTYYLPIVQSDASVEPLRALLKANLGTGLTSHDVGELLSLAVRLDQESLARMLIEHDVPLPADPQATIPSELKGNGSQTLADNPWVEALSPHHSDAMLALIIEQIRAAGEQCPVRSTWFKLHFREEGFSRKIATIVPESSGTLCENIPETILVLARGGHAHALSCALAWPETNSVDLEPALSEAQTANQLECAALILSAMSSNTPALGMLDW